MFATKDGCVWTGVTHPGQLAWESGRGGGGGLVRRQVLRVYHLSIDGDKDLLDCSDGETLRLLWESVNTSEQEGQDSFRVQSDKPTHDTYVLCWENIHAVLYRTFLVESGPVFASYRGYTCFLHSLVYA